MFQKVWLMNLKRRTDRYQQSMSTLQISGMPMELLEVFPAIDRSDYKSAKEMIEAHGYTTINPLLIQEIELPLTSNNERMKGKIGCWVSHYILLERASKMQDGTWVIVLEDDIAYHTSWQDMCHDFKRVLEQHPDSDMVILTNRDGISRNNTGSNRSFGTDAYAIRSDAARRILPLFRLDHEYATVFSVDNHFDTLCRNGHLKIYTLPYDRFWIQNVGHFTSDIETEA